MLLRIVKMTFKADEVNNFIELFNTYKTDIRNFPGCHGLELMRDCDNQTIFFTYSRWQSSEQLEKYRNSDLFKIVWPKTRLMFSEKAEAWSVDKIVSLP